MKNNLKLILSITLTSLLSITCKKNLTETVKSTPVKELTQFTVTSNTFKDGVIDHSLLKDLQSPQLSWTNTPVGTKALAVVMDDGRHVYWSHSIKNKSTSLKENELGIDGGFKLPNENSESTIATIELFALNCETNEIQDKVYKAKIENKIINKDIDQTRIGVRKLLEKMGLSNAIIGSATISYTIKKQGPIAKKESLDLAPEQQIQQ